MLTLIPVAFSNTSMWAARPDEGGVFSVMTLSVMPSNCLQLKPSGASIFGRPSTQPPNGSSELPDWPPEPPESPELAVPPEPPEFADPPELFPLTFEDEDEDEELFPDLLPPEEHAVSTSTHAIMTASSLKIHDLVKRNPSNMIDAEIDDGSDMTPAGSLLRVSL
mgnify:CR=1 FL=1